MLFKLEWCQPPWILVRVWINVNRSDTFVTRRTTFLLQFHDSFYWQKSVFHLYLLSWRALYCKGTFWTSNQAPCFPILYINQHNYLTVKRLAFFSIAGYVKTKPARTLDVSNTVLACFLHSPKKQNSWSSINGNQFICESKEVLRTCNVDVVLVLDVASAERFIIFNARKNSWNFLHLHKTVSQKCGCF